MAGDQGESESQSEISSGEVRIAGIRSWSCNVRQRMGSARLALPEHRWRRTCEGELLVDIGSDDGERFDLLRRVLIAACERQLDCLFVRSASLDNSRHRIVQPREYHQLPARELRKVWNLVLPLVQPLVESTLRRSVSLPDETMMKTHPSVTTTQRFVLRIPDHMPWPEKSVSDRQLIVLSGFSGARFM